MENVIAVIFDVESEAYQALSELKKDSVNSYYTILQIGLAKKKSGSILPIEGFDSGVNTADDTAKGGLIGALVGILGGPFGVLLGGGIGTLVGGAIDSSDADKNVSLLERVSGKLQDGDTFLAALVQESDESVFDSRMKKYKTTILRFDAAVISNEVEEAAKIQKEMEKEARQKLREKKVQEKKENLEAKRSRIQADFEAFKMKAKEK